MFFLFFTLRTAEAEQLCYRRSWLSWYCSSVRSHKNFTVSCEPHCLSSFLLFFHSHRAFSPGLSLDSFLSPQLLSAPISSVVPSFVNSLTYASDLGGGTQTQPKTATQPQAKVDNCTMQIVMQMRYHTI